MADNSFISQGIETVAKAIKADNEKDYQNALSLYREALSRFTMGLKYEKNETRKKLILERAAGYMNRAEELKEHLRKEEEEASTGGEKKEGEEKAEEGQKKQEKEIDDETKKLRGALSGAIVSEKPNIHVSEH